MEAIGDSANSKFDGNCVREAFNKILCEKEGEM